MSFVHHRIIGVVALLILATSVESEASFVDTFTTGIDPAWTTSISPSGGTVVFDTDHVKVTQLTNQYGNIRRSGGPLGVASVSADINNVSDGGISWAPSMVLYYDANNWIQFEVSSVYGFTAQVMDQGSGPSFAFAGYGQTQNTWDTLELKLNSSTGKAEFYAGPQGGPLTHITLATDISGGTLDDTPVSAPFFANSAYLILGKGYYSDLNGGFGTFFNNDLSPAFSNPGTSGDSLFDNAVLTSVPEPSAAMLLGLAGLGLLRRKNAYPRGA